MMKNKDFTCCAKCFKKIALAHTNAVRVWLKLCEFSITHGNIFTLNLEDFEELRILELLGFLVSTEKKTGITIKLVGIKHSLTNKHFCGEFCDEN